MEIKLTQKGKRLFDNLSRNIVSVSSKRAFALMEGDYAVKDKNFMALYARNLPKPKPKPKPEKVVVVEKPKPKPEPKPRKTRRKKATSKRAAKREKAVK